MKEATGEMNMTVVTIIAIGAILLFFWFMWPSIKNSISNPWNDVNTYDQNEQSKVGGDTTLKS